jgi:hypothetical protein
MSLHQSNARKEAAQLFNYRTGFVYTNKSMSKNGEAIQRGGGSQPLHMFEGIQEKRDLDKKEAKKDSIAH